MTVGCSTVPSERVKAELLNDWNAVRYFVIVVRRGGFTMAARSLGMKHEALRKKIRLLERRLDMQLFRSTGGRTNLTDDGNQLYQFSEQHLAGVSAADIYGEHSDLVLSLPKLVLESFLYREVISVLRENSGLKITLVDDTPELQKNADLVVWMQEPRRYSELSSQLVQPRCLSTQSFSLYVTERLIRGRMVPESLDDLDHYMAAQYQGYEHFANFAQWNDFIAQRRHGSVHVNSPDVQWQMVRWANCVGLLPDNAVYLDKGVRRLPEVLGSALELDIWVGLNEQAANTQAANMIAERITRAFSRR